MHLILILFKYMLLSLDIFINIIAEFYYDHWKDYFVPIIKKIVY